MDSYTHMKTNLVSNSKQKYTTNHIQVKKHLNGIMYKNYSS